MNGFVEGDTTEKGWEDEFNQEILECNSKDNLELYLVPRIDHSYQFWMIQNKTKQVRAFISKVEREAYEKGLAEGSRGDYGRKMYQQGYEEGRREVTSEALMNHTWIVGTKEKMNLMEFCNKHKVDLAIDLVSLSSNKDQ